MSDTNQSQSQPGQSAERQRDANGELILSEQERAASRKKLVMIFALFFVPLFLATIWMQMVKAGGGSWGNTSRGELISPAVPIEAFALTDSVSGEIFDLDALRGKWTILYKPDSQCADDCEKTLYDIRQARLALNHRMERVQRVVLLEQNDTLSAAVLEQQLGLQVLTISKESGSLSSQITAAQEKMEIKSGLIYLFDPLGNLMMRYTADQLPRPLFKDLKHLLKVSRIG